MKDRVINDLSSITVCLPTPGEFFRNPVYEKDIHSSIRSYLRYLKINDSRMITDISILSDTDINSVYWTLTCKVCDFHVVLFFSGKNITSIDYAVIFKDSSTKECILYYENKSSVTTDVSITTTLVRCEKIPSGSFEFTKVCIYPSNIPLKDFDIRIDGSLCIKVCVDYNSTHTVVFIGCQMNKDTNEYTLVLRTESDREFKNIPVKWQIQVDGFDTERDDVHSCSDGITYFDLIRHRSIDDEIETLTTGMQKFMNYIYDTSVTLKLMAGTLKQISSHATDIKGDTHKKIRKMNKMLASIPESGT